MGRQILLQGKSVIVRGRQLVDVFRVEWLVDRDLAVLTMDQVRDLAEVPFALQLIDQLQQRGLAFEYDEVVRQIEQPRTAPQIVHQPRENAAADRQVEIGIGLLDQPAERQTWDYLAGGGDGDPDQVRLIG